MKKLQFLAYDGSGFFEYLLNSRQASRIAFENGDITITLNDEYDRFSKKQKTELIASRLKLARERKSDET